MLKKQVTNPSNQSDIFVMSRSTRKNILLISIIFICLCLAYTTGFGAYWMWNKMGQAVHNSPGPQKVFWEVWNYVEEYFYGELPPPSGRTYGAIHEALLLLNDPYTVFVEPQPRELERDEMRGAFGGIGVTLWHNAEHQIVLSPYVDSPAQYAGVQDGDILLGIDGEMLSDQTTTADVRAWFHDEIGTQITLTISRPPAPPFDLVITRAEIQVPSVVWRVLDQAPSIGYIHIKSFTERTGDEVITALEELKQKTMISSLILDLRDNAGGLLDPSVLTASQFLSEGIVLIERHRDGKERTFPVQNNGLANDIPLAVLINGGTASASEIVAGALQDYDRGVLIGEPTYGKGSVQLIYELSDGSSLHVTSAIWLTPDQHQIEGQGLTPDIYVPRENDSLDEQLDRAVVYLQSQLD
ncbi:MAG: S41 family peptidase [Chloroflexi bacterium]|nr:S41 family peptidase [Chloroflexota bacterium]